KCAMAKAPLGFASERAAHERDVAGNQRDARYGEPDHAGRRRNLEVIVVRMVVQLLEIVALAEAGGIREGPGTAAENREPAPDSESGFVAGGAADERERLLIARREAGDRPLAAEVDHEPDEHDDEEERAAERELHPLAAGAAQRVRARHRDERDDRDASEESEERAARRRDEYRGDGADR